MAIMQMVSSQEDALGAQLVSMGSELHCLDRAVGGTNNVHPSKKLDQLWANSHAMAAKATAYLHENIGSTEVGYFTNDTLRPLLKKLDVLTTSGRQMQYVMCHPAMTEGYNRGIDYFGHAPESTEVGFGNPYYHRLYDGVMVEENEELVIHNYCDDHTDIEELTDAEREAILRTHQTVEALEIADMFDDHLEYF